MPLSNFLPGPSKPTENFNKRDGIYKINALFYFFYLYIILSIINRGVNYFLDSDYENSISLIVAPIGIFLVIICIMIIVTFQLRRLKIPKQKSRRYLRYFDIIKILIYGILVITVMESRLQDFSTVKDKTSEDMFWLASEISLLTLVTFFSLNKKTSNLLVIIFYFVYSYMRMQGYLAEEVEASFYFVKVLPFAIYIYKLKLFEEKTQENKTKQHEERKFASRVLNLLPEGVAIIDDKGLKYMNNSMRTIMRVKDDQCFDALCDLENRQFVGQLSTSSLLKKSFSESSHKVKGNGYFFPTNETTKSPFFSKVMFSTDSKREKTKEKFKEDKKYNKYESEEDNQSSYKMTTKASPTNKLLSYKTRSFPMKPGIESDSIDRPSSMYSGIEEGQSGKEDEGKYLFLFF